MHNRLLRIFILVTGVFLIVNLSRSIFDLWQKGSLLDQEEERYAKAKLENEELTKQLEQLENPQYIEKQAREKLGLGKEGEAVVILPPLDEEKKNTEEKKSVEEIKETVWKQWVEVLLN